MDGAPDQAYRHGMPTDRDATEVVVVGGGVAGLELLLALRDLAGDRVHVTLVTPDSELVDRPMTVAEPFGLGHARRYPLDTIASEHGARLLHVAVSAVAADERRVVLRSGDALAYDILVLAVGASIAPAFVDAVTFGQPGSGEEMRALLADLERGAARRVAFVAPSMAGWSLPLYELALMTGRFAPEAELFLVTPEERPLAVFGKRAGDEVAALLAALGVEFIGSTYPDVQPGEVLLDRAGRSLAVDRVVALPLVRGPKLEGVPGEPDYGFIPVDPHGRVTGLDDVYAAGDATDFPIKQGGLATQQADAVAEHVAARVGAPVTPTPFRPVLRGMLFTGGEERYLRVAVGAGPGESSAQPLWWPPTKIAGRYLAPYLLAPADRDAIGRPPPGFVDVEIPLEDLRLPPAPPIR